MSLFSHDFETCDEDHVCTLQQLSRGTVNIKSADPHAAPAIDPKDF